MHFQKRNFALFRQKKMRTKTTFFSSSLKINKVMSEEHIFPRQKLVLLIIKFEELFLRLKRERRARK